LGALASRLAGAKDGAEYAPWKTRKPFSTFAPARRLDVRMEESMAEVKSRIDGWWNEMLHRK
jgi:hypothetical protein